MRRRSDNPFVNAIRVRLRRISENHAICHVSFRELPLKFFKRCHSAPFDIRRSALDAFQRIELVNSIQEPLVCCRALHDELEVAYKQWAAAHPNGQAAPGNHWYYRLDRASGRRCWSSATVGPPAHRAAR